ncbi:hypothetical protein [Mycolicibacter acidiphilus]|uniref:hypothetical protein n=1 Tax=Mycolicibacter acidiphilus TaxID=2835306 RepID=UPI002023057C|nr:hypothetical protein [Mycolicibacter acidiphilus]
MPDEQQPDASAEVDEAVTEAVEREQPAAETVPAPHKTVAKKAPAKKAPAKKPAAKKPAKDAKESAPEAASGPVLSAYGVGSAVLGLVAVAAVAFGYITWSAHHSDLQERSYRSKVLQTAASWTNVLINLNAENVEKGMQRLRDKSVGDLNNEFEAAVAPYRDVVQRIQSRSSGRIEAVAIETVSHDPDNPDAAAPNPSSTLGRTDPVLVVATSVAENVEGRPQTVHWTLHLDVTDVDGKMMISKLRSIR